MRDREHSDDTWIRADTARAIARIASAEEGIPILLRAWEETDMYPESLIGSMSHYSTVHPQVVPFLIEAASRDYADVKNRAWLRHRAVRGRLRPPHYAGGGLGRD